MNQSAANDSSQSSPAKRRANRDATARDIDYMSDASAAFLERTPRSGRAILWVTVAFFACAVAWASNAELDEVTRGIGRVVPSRQVQVVQNLEGGILAELLVREGDVVEDDQVLLRIDDTRFSSSLRENRVRYLALKAKAARLTAQSNDTDLEAPVEVLENEPSLIEQERALLESRQDELASTIEILKRQMTQREQELAELRTRAAQLKRSRGLVGKELKMTRPLVADGAISEVEVLRLEREMSELRGQFDGNRHAITRVGAKLAEAETKIREAKLRFQNEARTELNDTLTELSGLSESGLALSDRVDRTAVRSPVRGTVKELLVNTVGGVIQPGADLVKIVPLEDTLLVEARIRPSDIAFLRPGQNSVVKFTAYDFAIYGGLDGNLEQIGADTITDERNDTFYRVLVRTERNYLGDTKQPLPLIPGMLTEVDILTGKKTVMDYLLKPVLRAKSRALRER